MRASIAASATRVLQSDENSGNPRTGLETRSFDFASLDINSTNARIRFSTQLQSHSLGTCTVKPTRTGGGGIASSSGSESKAWRKKRRSFGSSNALPNSIYSRIFKLVFVFALVLFLRALFGIGVAVPPLPPPEQQRTEYDQSTSDRVRLSRIYQRRWDRIVMDHPHDYLAVDPDGHYSYSFSFAEDDAYRWRWRRKNSNNTMVAVPSPSRADADASSIPTATIQQKEEEKANLPSVCVKGDEDEDAATVAEDNPLHTPPPIIPHSNVDTSTLSHAHVKNHPITMKEDQEARDNDNDKDEDEALALRLFEPGDPVYALRIHLPTPPPPPPKPFFPVTRGRWGRRNQHRSGVVF